MYGVKLSQVHSNIEKKRNSIYFVGKTFRS